MMREHLYFVYILASERNGTLYVGVTNDLIGRVAEHREGAVPGFTKRHDIKLLVYFEEHDEIERRRAPRDEALARQRAYGRNADTPPAPIEETPHTDIEV